ncbi:hypothetical protein ABMC88_06435 [Sulfitobacter sp. HNIBRBA2951]|uniref:hypothetical protein n=1 Tax=Sulfitobacter aquimarinus TaxID=3158557 RepID=UPI0032DF9EC6
MSVFIICVVLLGPQAFAAMRGVGPAGMLMLLVLCIAGMMAVLVVAAMPPGGALESTAYDQDTYYVVHLTLFGYAVLGVMLLTLLYWVVEWARPQADMRVDVVLVQGVVALMTAAVVLGLGPDGSGYGGDMRPVVLIEGGALAMVGVLAVRAVWHLLLQRPR